MLKQEVDYSTDCCKGLIYYRRSEKRENLLSVYDIVKHVTFAFEFDGNFEIFILWNSGINCRVTTAIVSSSTSLNPVMT